MTLFQRELAKFRNRVDTSGMNFGEWVGLLLLLIALLITIAILIYDAMRKWYWHIPTISWNQWVALRYWRENGYKVKDFPWLVLLLPLGVAIQAVGLLWHFLAGLSPYGLQQNGK